MMGKVVVLKKMLQKFIKSCLFEKNVVKMFGMLFYLLLIKVKEMKQFIQKIGFFVNFYIGCFYVLKNYSFEGFLDKFDII